MVKDIKNKIPDGADRPSYTIFIQQNYMLPVNLLPVLVSFFCLSVAPIIPARHDMFPPSLGSLFSSSELCCTADQEESILACHCTAGLSLSHERLKYILKCRLSH